MALKPRPRNFFAIDVSGSTSNEFYWKHVESIFHDNFHENDIILCWNHQTMFIDKEKALKLFAKRKGIGGTRPSGILRAIGQVLDVSKFNLILITDGDIDPAEIDACDELSSQNKIIFALTTAYILPQTKKVNMSVVASFSRYSPSTITVLKNETRYNMVMPLQTVTESDIALLHGIDRIESVEHLARIYDRLSLALSIRVLGSKGDVDLHNAFVNLKKRLSKSFSKGGFEAPKALATALDKHDQEAALRAGSVLVESYVVPDNFDVMINRLIFLSSGGLRFVFSPSEIQAARAVRASETDEVTVIEAVELDYTPLNNATFQCPITTDDEVDPCIMVALPEQPLLIGLPKKQVDFLIDSPLNALHSPAFLDSIVAHLDHPVSLSMVRSVQNTSNAIWSSPMTRRNLLGFLPLGPHKSHVQASDWTLSQLISGGKRVGNSHLWFAVVWMLVKRGRVPFLKEVEPFLEEQLVFRQTTARTSASLTGLTNFVTTPVRFDGALFFCLFSEMFKTKPDVTANPLRLHIPHIVELLELAELVKISVPPALLSFIHRTAALLALLSVVKQMGTDPFRTLMAGLVQRIFFVDRSKIGDDIKGNHAQRSTAVLLDGPPTADQTELILSHLPAACRRVPPNELFALSLLVNPSQSAVDVQIALNATFPPLPAPAVNWAHYEGHAHQLLHIPICPATLRPYSRVNHAPWETQLAAIVGDLKDKRVFSFHKMLMVFVGRIQRIPSVDELLLDMAFRLSHSSRPVTTLPSDAVLLVSSTLDDFAPLLQDNLKAAISRFRSAGSRDARKEMEKDGRS
ncbi:hypothetical protein BLNAU_20740 [Blattamonas nauphoetae]|uniref:VWFA domain-containing protein n=1 Tax=Blattamonas nauphoetae TaxID=2049346 RepID=A0ABQ9WXV2_9EUKA|nr:hypothetical protein BLNAU_20740 [Blattamonas nauphoetae]